MSRQVNKYRPLKQYYQSDVLTGVNGHFRKHDYKKETFLSQVQRVKDACRRTPTVDGADAYNQQVRTL